MNTDREKQNPPTRSQLNKPETPMQESKAPNVPPKVTNDARLAKAKDRASIAPTAAEASDVHDRALEDSFPASDPPSLSPITSVGDHH